MIVKWNASAVNDRLNDTDEIILIGQAHANETNLKLRNKNCLNKSNNSVDRFTDSDTFLVSNYIQVSHTFHVKMKQPTSDGVSNNFDKNEIDANFNTFKNKLMSFLIVRRNFYHII